MLHSEDILPQGGSAQTWMVFLHGILGRGVNWRSFARNVIDTKQYVGATLPDLRMHGQSQDFTPPYTIEATAEDLVRLQKATRRIWSSMLGHSFGGKVALEYARQTKGDLEELWVIDSQPGAASGGVIVSEVSRVLTILRETNKIHMSREGFRQEMEDKGLSRSLAQWLAMNLERTEDGSHRLAIKLEAIDALLRDHFRHDLWSVVESPEGKAVIHLIIAGKSSVYSTENRERAFEAAKKNPDRVKVHVMPEAGHWVHVDDPKGLFTLITDNRLKSSP